MICGLHFLKIEHITGYRRELDLSDAVCKTTYEADGIKYTREYFASYPGNVIAVNLTASKKASLTFDISMTALHEGFSVTPSNEGTLILNVRVKDGALYGTAIVKVTLKGGDISFAGNKIHIEKADETTILLAAATNFVSPV